jgi:antirestriction protein ArdC
MKKAKRDIDQEITNSIIASLEAGTPPWHKSWKSLGGQALRENGKPYRGINQFILGFAPYSNPYWMTFKKAAELAGEGGGVRKGEKGTAVVFFKFIDKKNKETGEVESRIPLLRYYVVFNAEQIDGLPEKYFPTADDLEPIEKIEKAEQYFGALGGDVRYSGDRAFYSPSEDFIQMPIADAFEDGEAFYGTLAHEYGHWTGAESRLDRKIQNGFGSPAYAKEELIAELSAAMLLGRLGISAAPRADHASYLASWLEVLKADKTAIRKAAGKAQAVVDYLDELSIENKMEEAA